MYGMLFYFVSTLFFPVVDCGILTSPLNGLVSVNQTSFNAMVLYGCRYGYQLLGNSSRTCLASGEWSNSEPQCEGEVVT